MELLFLLVLSSLLCVLAWYIARERRSWFWWDYATVLGPMLFWYALSILQVGPQSLSNLIELLVVGAFVPIAVSCRVFLLDRLSKSTMRSSLIASVACFVLPLALRLAMPPLPE